MARRQTIAEQLAQAAAMRADEVRETRDLIRRIGTGKKDAEAPPPAPQPESAVVPFRRRGLSDLIAGTPAPSHSGGHSGGHSEGHSGTNARTSKKILNQEKEEDKNLSSIFLKTSCTVPEHVFTARWPCLYQAGFTASQLEQVGDELAKAGRSAELVAEGLDHAEWELRTKGNLYDAAGQTVHSIAGYVAPCPARGITAAPRGSSRMLNRPWQTRSARNAMRPAKRTMRLSGHGGMGSRRTCAT